MNITIISACNVRGVPANAGDVIETDDVSAHYLISIGKAVAINPVEAQDAQVSEKTVKTARSSKAAELAVETKQEID